MVTRLAGDRPGGLVQLKTLGCKVTDQNIRTPVQVSLAPRALRPPVSGTIVLGRKGEVYIVCEQGEHDGEVPCTKPQQGWAGY